MPTAAEVEHTVLTAFPDLYAVLGVSKEASPNEIKKAYHKRALFLHPDKNTSSRATEAFKCVNTASEVLSDEEKRARYDAAGGGKDGLKHAMEEQASFPLAALLVGIAIWYRPMVDPVEEVAHMVSKVQAERAKQPQPTRSPEPWRRRSLWRMLKLAAMCAVLIVALAVDGFDRRKTDLVGFKFSPAGPYTVPATVKLPLASGALGKGKKKKASAMTTIFVGSESIKQRYQETLPRDVAQSALRQLKIACASAVTAARG
eukprot:CAMPEP_0174832212 /NCGR_PEP_ID=MMETSP1114-20130205/3553_1 /TAXON_ID=312471 /ORGANISM="Neobodo designis, Strain CCAP 1951/1" /LENGTH=258 /DNA_ID=CAMNT_0016066067 /DNA_START=26 /DNA_END=798 /DNA_ORIENTATION=+